MSMTILEMTNKTVFYLRRGGRPLDPTGEQAQQLQELLATEQGVTANLLGATLMVNRDSSRAFPEEDMHKAVLSAVTAVFGGANMKRKEPAVLSPELPAEDKTEEPVKPADKPDKKRKALQDLMG